MIAETLDSGTVITDETRPAWLATRRAVLGASEAPAALGVSEFATPLDLWQRKTGRAPDVVESEAMRWGSLLEPVILAEYERRTGFSVACRQLFLRHPDHPFLAATLDGIAGDSRLVEVKTASAWARDFGDEDSDTIPDAYRVQIHQQFAVTGATEADLVVLVGGQRLRIYPVVRDEALVRAVVHGCLKFWRCVETLTPPDWGKVTPQTLLALHPGCEGEIDLPGHINNAVACYEALGRDIDAATERRERLRVEILDAMGGAQVGRLDDGRRVRRYVQDCPERTTTTRAHTKHYFKILKGGRS